MMWRVVRLSNLPLVFEISHNYKLKKKSIRRMKNNSGNIILNVLILTFGSRKTIKYSSVSLVSVSLTKSLI